MNYGGFFDITEKEQEILKLEKLMEKDGFWSDRKESEKIIQKLNNLKNSVKEIKELKKLINDNLELCEIADDEMLFQIENQIEDIINRLDKIKLELLLNGPYDHENAILEIHSGAGGTEACDWADMLRRMYFKWCDKKNYKVEIVYQQLGDTVGIKSLTAIIKGFNCYGYLKNEKGVHRLVRISPFDSNSRRHTSFASVDITPLFDNQDIDIEIKDSDLKIDVYRSSGAGGQSVNTTDSAVRITHIPSKIVVTCQNERSQIQNKEKALEILKNKLYQIELEKKEQEIQKLKGNLNSIEFGSQIRSYVMHPYSMVKDHRYNVETSNVEKVLDGDIDLFINTSLKVRKK